MLNNDTPNNEDSTTTQQAELKRLLEEVQAATHPLAKAVRKKLQGHDVDMNAARLAATLAIDSVISQVSPASKRGPESYTPVDLAGLYWDRIAERKEYASTGFAQLNRAMSGGFDHDRLVVLLGAPGAGKTTFANQIADHVAGSKRPVLYVTSEDTPFTLYAKTLARRGQIDYTAVLRGYPSERERISAAMQEYSATENVRWLRYVDATQGITLDGIFEQAVRHFQALASEADGAPLLVVDYLQRLSRGENLGADARQSATIYTERLRIMACELHATVLCLSAMNRVSGYRADNSTIASAKESGDIDYTADTIMAIGGLEDAPEPAPGTRRYMLRIDKNRQGFTTYSGSHILLDWIPTRQQFTEAERAESAAPVATGNGAYTRGRR
jgi:replicative DNA helicase